MKAKQALKLVGDSAHLAKVLEHDFAYDYYVWLSFVDEYKDVDYEEHRTKLDALKERYNTIH